MVTPSDGICATAYLEEQHEISERDVYQMLALNRNTKRRLERCEQAEDVVDGD